MMNKTIDKKNAVKKSSLKKSSSKSTKGKGTLSFADKLPLRKTRKTLKFAKKISKHSKKIGKVVSSGLYLYNLLQSRKDPEAQALKEKMSKLPFMTNLKK